jgi:hypothetical protein
MKEAAEGGGLFGTLRGDERTDQRGWVGWLPPVKLAVGPAASLI